eukprot:COSAG04_NODE_512_length_13248_cov_51.630314_19_plen_321_part_00
MSWRKTVWNVWNEWPRALRARAAEGASEREQFDSSAALAADSAGTQAGALEGCAAWPLRESESAGERMAAAAASGGSRSRRRSRRSLSSLLLLLAPFAEGQSECDPGSGDRSGYVVANHSATTVAGLGPVACDRTHAGRAAVSCGATGSFAFDGCDPLSCSVPGYTPPGSECVDQSALCSAWVVSLYGCGEVVDAVVSFAAESSFFTGLIAELCPVTCSACPDRSALAVDTTGYVVETCIDDSAGFLEGLEASCALSLSLSPRRALPAADPSASRRRLGAGRDGDGELGLRDDGPAHRLRHRHPRPRHHRADEPRPPDDL